MRGKAAAGERLRGRPGRHCCAECGGSEGTSLLQGPLFGAADAELVLDMREYTMNLGRVPVECFSPIDEAPVHEREWSGRTYRGHADLNARCRQSSAYAHNNTRNEEGLTLAQSLVNVTDFVLGKFAQFSHTSVLQVWPMPCPCLVNDCTIHLYRA